MIIRLSDADRYTKKMLYKLTGDRLLGELKNIVVQARTLRKQIGQEHRRATWADWLQSKAAQGSGPALSALRARQNQSAQRGDAIAGTGPRTPFVHTGADSVTKQGTIIYRFDGTVVRDDGRALHIGQGADTAGLQAALRLATSRYGSNISVNGSAAFRESIVQAAASGALPLHFADAALEQRRIALMHATATKEAPHARHAQWPAPGSAMHNGAGAAATDIPAHRTEGHRVSASPQAGKPALGENRRQPPSELGMVRVADEPALLPPRDAPRRVEQDGIATAHSLRPSTTAPGNLGAAMKAAQYVEEQERQRHAGAQLVPHRVFAGAERALPLAGTRIVDGQGLALLLDGGSMLVKPVNAATLQRLQREKQGSIIDVNKLDRKRSQGHGR